MTATRLRGALLVALSLTLVLLALHPRSLLAAKPVANRLHESRHSNPGRRLLTHQRQSFPITDESKRLPRSPVPTEERVATRVSIVPVRVLDQLSKPAYLQFFRDPQHACSPPS
jgi:uncharacterized protein (DUF58 family)